MPSQHRDLESGWCVANENSKGSKEGCGCPWASVMVMVMGEGVLVADRSYLNFTSWVKIKIKKDILGPSATFPAASMSQGPGKEGCGRLCVGGGFSRGLVLPIPGVSG